MKPYSRPWRSCIRWTATSLLLFVVFTPLLAQVTLFPMDYQLYPRDLSTNKATIHVTGSVPLSSGYKQVRLKRYRNGSLQKTTYITLVYDLSGNALYDIYNEITAELANYKFSLYGYNGSKEILIKSVQNVVAGDAYIIQGQSNAVANLRGTFSTANNADDPSNSPYRNYVRVYGNGSATSSYTKAWFIGKGNIWYDQDGQCGQWGMRLGSDLAGATKVPVALFNGASPGQRISYFFRNDNNPHDPNTNYGRLLNRITEAGFKNNIRAVLWHQGESDILGSLSSVQLTTEQYKSAFLGLMSDWKEDFPGLAKFYMFQIRYGCGMSNADNCLKIQEAQRELDKEHDDIITIGTDNSSQLYDGGTINYCHYNFYDGYSSFGDWMSNLLLRDLYGKTNLPACIESPEPQSAAFSQTDASGLANQLIISLKDQATTFTMNGDISPMLRLDGGNYTVNSTSINGNSIVVNFTRNSGTSSNPTSVSYRGHDQVAAPVVINTSGLSLIHFEYLPIGTGTVPPPPPPTTICPDNFEPDNTSADAKAINANTTYTGSIASSTDEDWYRFRTWSPWRYVKVSIWGMTADYDLYLYANDGVTLLSSSTLSGNQAEAVIYNDGPDNSYYRLKVVSKTGAFDASTCYSFRLQASSAPWPNSTPYATSSKNGSIGSPMETIARVSEDNTPIELGTYPNPVLQTLSINYPSAKTEAVELRIADLSGRQLLTRTTTANAGKNLFQLNLGGLHTGVYMLQIRKADGTLITRKFIVGSR